MRIHKILAALLAVAMVFSIVPASALAAGGSSNADADSNLFLTKDTTLESDGSYSINMEAYATGTTKIETETKKVPLDIILVLDQSTSMRGSGMEGLKKAANGFLDAVQSDAQTHGVDHRVAVVGFATKRPDEDTKNTGLFLRRGNGVQLVSIDGLNDADYQSAYYDAQQDIDLLHSCIDALQNHGRTDIDAGMEMAQEVLKNNPTGPERKKVVIAFTDGEPGGKNGFDENVAARAVATGNAIAAMENTVVYSIGLYDRDPGKQVNDFMFDLSSAGEMGEGRDVKYVKLKGEPDTSKVYYIKKSDGDFQKVEYGSYGGWGNKKTGWHYGRTGVDPKKEQFYVREESEYYLVAANADALNQIFQSIQQSITTPTTSVTLDNKSILRDILAEGFALTDASTVTVSIQPGEEHGTADASNIVWGQPVEVLNLTNPTDGAFKTGAYQDMTIKASTHMVNPDSAKKNLHTVDVTGFNYKEQYVAEGHNGSKLIVKITGIQALPGVATDVNVATNNDLSGIWAPATAGGERVLNVAMPQRPETRLTSKNYVVDYAKQLELPIADVKMNTAQNIDAAGYNPFAAANTAITHKYGKVALNDNTLTYTPTNMNWDGYDTFYVFGQTADKTVKAASANANGNVWGKVNVIPANNVYYEDSFVTNESNGTVGIIYDGNGWQTEGTDAPQTVVKPEAGENQGWIPVLGEETGDTDGSSHHANAADGKSASAKFTFTGTGVDIYSRTSGSTGTVLASLFDSSNQLAARQIIDTKSASDEYYQIPTLSFHGLAHDTYRVELIVTTAAAGRMDYYLDGVRVYNPVKEDETVQNAYGPDELNAAFVEVRDMLLDTTNAPAGPAELNGVVFIDELPGGESGTTAAIGTYEDYGPKNEVYLPAGKSIVFKVNEQPGNRYQIGLKSPAGTPAEVELTGAAGKTPRAIPHTADLYYDVVPSNGIITVKNVGSGLVSITKLKVTNANGPVDTASVFAAVPTDELLNAVQLFAAAPVAPEVTPEPTPEVKPEPTPEVTPEPTPDVEIEVPDVPEKPARPTIGGILDKIFGGIRSWF